MLRGVILFSLLLAGTIPIFLLLLLFGVPTLILPEAARVTLRGPQILCGRLWIAMCVAGLGLFGVPDPELEGGAALDSRGRYLVLANHTSWTDILILLQLFGPRMPFPRFLAKREILWVPFIGIAIWLLDFPLLRRSRRDSSPERAARDHAAVARGCRRLGSGPFTLVVFPEGTRFSQAKKNAQQGPFELLLMPRAGGTAVAIEHLGPRLDAVVDVTIAYAPRGLSYWGYLCGRGRARVHVEFMPLPRELRTAEEKERKVVQEWLNVLWQQKDQRLQTWRENLSGE